jgi:hypothetical protein
LGDQVCSWRVDAIHELDEFVLETGLVVVGVLVDERDHLSVAVAGLLLVATGLELLRLASRHYRQLPGDVRWDCGSRMSMHTRHIIAGVIGITIARVCLWAIEFWLRWIRNVKEETNAMANQQNQS